MNHFVRVLCDIYPVDIDAEPIYRVYVNDELFGERKWIWKNAYLEETLQIEAPSGDYRIRHEVIGTGQITVKNIRVDFGNASVNGDVLTINTIL